MKKIIIVCIACFAQIVTGALPGPETKVINGITYIQHKVVKGETIFGLAKKYNVSIETFKSVNNNVSSLQLNQLIWVPKAKTTSAENTTKPVENTSSNSTVKPSSKELKTHVVAKGETLYSIAKKYNVTINDLKTWNKLGENPIALGAKLSLNAYTAALQSSAGDKIVTIENTSKEDTDFKTNENVKVAVEKIEEAPKKIKITTEESTVTKTTNSVVIKNDETTETGQAIVSKSEDMLADRCFVKHPSVPVGTILVVINPASGKMAYCRVIENKTTQSMNNAKVEITSTVAEKIGLTGEKGQVSIRFATL